MALGDLEKAQIGTLHSLAAHLIHLHPIECGVDPSFQEDDESRFLEHFQQRWGIFVDQELGAHGRDHQRWRRVLGNVALVDMRELAFALSSELITVDRLIQQVESVSLTPKLREWLQSQCTRAKELLSSHHPKKTTQSGILSRDCGAYYS